ncbi:hypothetical protein NDU88_005401 [Pleurodeles waltl]|uniref:Uncharacterized protein n=1 Tax=Pleurodeles waltl TaxID=8319 RepID=A0AAV7UM23_PLEWA|nr:hypothetical protein NDU88_005401 [Pleurodeles waltl]
MPQQVREWLDALGPTERENKDGAAKPRKEPLRQKGRRLTGAAPPRNQALQERQDAVKAVASLGQGAPPLRTRPRLTQIRNQHPMISPAHHRIQLTTYQELPQGHPTRSFEKQQSFIHAQSKQMKRHGSNE